MSSEPKTELVESNFKLVFLSVLFLTLVFIGITSYIAIFGQNPPTVLQEDLYSSSKDILKILIGAIAGLLGGKGL